MTSGPPPPVAGRSLNAAGPDGYRLVLPEGWVRLNVRDDLSDTVAEVLDKISFDDLPRDERPKRRVAITARLRAAIEKAQSIDAYAMYLPLFGMHGLAIPASFVIAAATDFTGDLDEGGVLDRLSSAPNTERVTIDGSNAVRSESITSSIDEQSGVKVGGRQVVYTVQVPGTAEWLVSVYDVVTAAEHDEDYEMFVQALVTLFDGIMSTFRWRFG